MQKLILTVVAAATVAFAGAASAHGHSGGNSHQPQPQPTYHQPQPIATVGVGAQVGNLLGLGVGAQVGGRTGLLNVQTAARTPVAAAGVGVNAGSSRRGGELSLDIGALVGGVGGLGR